ncbi:hypothetical protein OPIT5_25240 [Opitutaceae bacterium TAV5]|nr:hypothetical protein OPIT5_25240 [Opitutaceae bacterium TAV5]
MNPLVSGFAFFSTQYPATALFVLCALKSSLIVLSGWLVASALRRRSARARCWVWRCTLLACAGLLLMEFGPAAVQRVRRALPAVVATPAQAQATRERAVAFRWVPSIEEINRLENEKQEQFRAEERASPVVRPPWEKADRPRLSADDMRLAPWRQIERGLPRVWGFGAGLFAAVTLLRVAAGRWWLRRSSGPADDGLAGAARRVAASLRTGRRLRIRLTPRVPSPLLVGFFVPVIYLPETARGWSGEKLRAVFLHELAHWQRRDPLWQLAGRLIACALWWQPLVAWAARRMGAEAEAAADDVAVLHETGVAAYARSLVEIARVAGAGARGAPAGGVSMVGRTALEKRIRALLAANPWRGRVGKLAAGFIVLLAVGAGVIASTYVGVATGEKSSANVRVKSSPAKRMSAEERATLQRIFDNTTRRLTALRYLHFRLEKEPSRLAPDGTVTRSPIPEKMEAWVDEWTGVHRAEFRPYIPLFVNSTRPFDAWDRTSINNGENSYTYDDALMPSDQFTKSGPGGLERYLGIAETQELLRLVRRLLDWGYPLGKSLVEVEYEGRMVTELQQNIYEAKETGKLTQQTIFRLDPQQADILCYYESFSAWNERGTIPRRWILEETGRTASGVIYPKRWRTVFPTETEIGTEAFHVTQLEVLSELPADIVTPFRSRESEFVAKGGTAVRHGRIEIRYEDAVTGRSVATGSVTARIYHDDRWHEIGEMAPDVRGRVVISLPGKTGPEIIALNVKMKAPGYAPQVVEWTKTGDPLQLPEIYVAHLWPASPIAGRVLDPDDKPVAGAEVKIWLWNGGSGPMPVYRDRFDLSDIAVKTDAAGRWKAEGFPENLMGLGLIVIASGYRQTSALSGTAVRMLTGQPYESLRDGSSVIHLRPEVVVNGRVLDAQGEPAKGASVTLFTEDVDTRGTVNRGTVKAGQQGEFSFGQLPHGTGRIIVDEPLHKPVMVEISIPSETPVHVRLEPGNVVKGRVVGEDGKPRAGLDVHPETWRGKRHVLDYSTQTDAEGRFIWRGAPDDEVEFVFGGCRNQEILTNVMLTAKPEEQTFIMKPALRLDCAVVDAKTGQPVLKVKLVPGQVWDDREPSWDRRSAKTHDGGRVTWQNGWLGEKWIFLLEADGYEPLRTPTYEGSQRDITETFRLIPRKQP